MAKGDVRLIERSYMQLLLERNPEFYAEKRKQLLYKFSNNREFRGDPERVATAYPRED